MKRWGASKKYLIFTYLRMLSNMQNSNISGMMNSRLRGISLLYYVYFVNIIMIRNSDHLHLSNYNNSYETFNEVSIRGTNRRLIGCLLLSVRKRKMRLCVNFWPHKFQFTRQFKIAWKTNNVFQCLTVFLKDRKFDGFYKRQPLHLRLSFKFHVQVRIMTLREPKNLKFWWHHKDIPNINIKNLHGLAARCLAGMNKIFKVHINTLCMYNSPENLPVLLVVLG